MTINKETSATPCSARSLTMYELPRVRVGKLPRVTTLETAKKRCDAAASGLGNVKKRCIRPQILFS